MEIQDLGNQKDVFDFEDLLNVLAVQIPDKDVPPTGLYIKNQGSDKFGDFILGLPLKNIDYLIEVVNNLAKVTLTQQYFNPTKHYIETEYSFPIEPKAVIHSFKATFGTTIIVGQVKEKKKAREDYEQGLKEGRQVAYGEIDDLSFDVLNLQIGNIPPNTYVSIEIQYIQQLDVVMSTFWKLIIVSRVMPRYIMQNAPDRWLQSAKSIRALSNYKKPSYTWNFNLILDSQYPVTFRQSSSHKISEISKQKRKNVDKLQFVLDKKQRPDRDFVFLYCTQSVPQYTLGITDTTTAAVISFIPKFSSLKPTDVYQMMQRDKKLEIDISSIKGEFIFFVDRSGSMAGDAINYAIQAFRLFIKSLPQDSFINIVSFGSKYDLMFKKSMKYTKKLIKQIDKNLNQFSANYGGTQIYEPLKKVLQDAPVKDYPRHIFLLTDGGVSDTQTIIKLVQSHIRTTRVHTIGIGDGVSEALIKGCAEKGKGKYVFIKDNKNIRNSIIEVLQSSLSSLITDIRLQFDKNIIQCIVPNPNHIPFILQNDPLNFYIIFNQRFKKKAKFTLKYTDSKNIEYQNIIQIENDPKASFRFVQKMVQHKKISILYQKSQNNQKLQNDILISQIKDLENSVINESVQHQILCPLTAFVCVGQKLKDQKYVEFLADKTQKEIPSPSHFMNLPGVRAVMKGGKGRVMKSRVYRPGSISCSKVRSSTKSKRHLYKQSRFEEVSKLETNQKSFQIPIIQQYNFQKLPTTRQKSKIQAKNNLTKLAQIINRQNFDGSWKTTTQLLNILFDKNQVQRFKKIAQKYDKNFVITSTIVKWLTQNHNKPQYSLIIKKANQWLEKNKDINLSRNDIRQINKLMIK